MATNRLFAYSSTPIAGASQSGSLSISTTPISGYRWWPGPDEDLGYIIAHTDNNPNTRTEGNRNAVVSTNAVGFWRTATQSDAAFLTMFNGIFSQNYATASTAANWLNNNGYWTSYSGSSSSTLGTIGNPAVSAQAIYNSGQTTNGWYYIQTSNMTSARQIYCNMTDQGGGWMLMTYNPNVNISSGTPYPNQWLGGTGSFASMVSIDTRQVWYHNGTAQCTQVMKMASATASLTPLLANIVIANKVVYTNPNNLRLTATFSSVSAVFTTNTPMSGTWSGIKGHTLMTGNLNVNAPGDWVYATSGGWWTVCGPSTAYPDAQGRSGNAQGSGSWTNNGNNNIYGMADVSTTTNSLRTDIKTYAVYIK
jgi:hypothetical protein